MAEFLCGCKRYNEGYANKMFKKLKNGKIGNGMAAESTIDYLFRLIMTVQDDLEANKIENSSQL
jgi:hypothetical protein